MRTRAGLCCHRASQVPETLKDTDTSSFSKENIAFSAPEKSSPGPMISKTVLDPQLIWTLWVMKGTDGLGTIPTAFRSYLM